MSNKASRPGHVTAATPPGLLWHTWADDVAPAENSLSYTAALRKHNGPCELHLYERGGHGLGLDTEFDWAAECRRWVAPQFPE